MKQLITVLFCLIVSSGFAQKFRISYEAGYGIYSLSNLKEFQLLYANEINDLPVRAVVQFPDFINHSASFCFYLDNENLLGVNTAYLTTGARNSLLDYSGRYNLDMLLNAYQFGIESEHIRNLKNKFAIHYNFKLGLIRSVLSTVETIKIFGAGESSNTDEFSQLDFYMEPNIYVSKHVFGNFAVNLCLGYNLNTSSIYKGTISWSGLRPKLGLTYSF